MLSFSDGGFSSVTLLQGNCPTIFSYWNTNLGEVILEREWPLSPTESLSALAIRERGPVRWHFGHQLPYDMHPSVAPLRSLKFLSVPLLNGDEPIGVLVLGNVDESIWTDNRTETMKELTHATSIGLNNARAYKSAQKEASFVTQDIIAHDIHDSVAQHLFAAGLKVNHLLNDEGMNAQYDINSFINALLLVFVL